MFKFNIIVWLFYSFFSTSLWAANIKVIIDRNPVNINESFQLTFSADSRPDGDPDFTPLEKDFEILSQSQQSSSRMSSDFKTSHTLQWVVTLMAKQTGTLIVPAITFGRDTSEFDAIIVNRASDSPQENKDIFVQVEVDETEPYLNQQVIYTFKIYFNKQISQPALTPPVVIDAIIEKLGEEKSYESQYKGRRYHVIEGRYAIFPQKSGVLTIPAITLTANVVVNNQRSSGFFSRRATRMQKINSNPVTLTVRVKPDSFIGQQWLPAQLVYLEQQWSEKSRTIVAGEPLTRTLTLLAQGTLQSMLPTLYHETLVDHVKAYPDQPSLKERAKLEGLTAFREEKIAFIFNQAGEYQLPALEIPWWNTRTGRMETARLPAETITVTAAAVREQTPAPIAVEPPALTQSPESVTGTDKTDTLWLPLALFFAANWLLTLIWILRSKTKAKITANEKTVAINFDDKALKKACDHHNAHAAKDALLIWAKSRFKAHNLHDLSQHCSAELQQEIKRLNHALYHHSAMEWEGLSLWKAFKNHKTIDIKTPATQDALPPLFKI